jgi:hypothetical protein
VKDNRLHYVHNYLKMQMTELISDSVLPKGAVRLRFEFTRTGLNQGQGALFVNSRRVAETKAIRTAPLGYSLASGEGFQIGKSWGTAVSNGYTAPFPFNGELHKVTVELNSRQDRSRRR